MIVNIVKVRKYRASYKPMRMTSIDMAIVPRQYDRLILPELGYCEVLWVEYDYTGGATEIKVVVD